MSHRGKHLQLLSMIMIRCPPPHHGCSRCVSSNMIGMIKVLPGEMTASSVIRDKTFVPLQVIVAPNVAPLGGACEQTAQRTDLGTVPGVDLQPLRNRDRKDWMSSLFWT